jgi:hypothetical protein
MRKARTIVAASTEIGDSRLYGRQRDGVTLIKMGTFVPMDTHRRLKIAAANERGALSAIVNRAIERELDRLEKAGEGAR